MIAESKISSRYGFSPLYSAPEQISPKKFGTPDKRTDIYQLGVVFYELVCGKLPFTGEDLAEIMMQIISEEPRAPSSVNPGAESVDHIILKCLAKKKEDRYQRVEDLQKEIGGFLKEEYTKSLKESVSGQDKRRSVYYCCELFMVHAKLNVLADALMYCKEMQNYAEGSVKEEVGVLVGNLEFMVKEGRTEVGEEFIENARILAHQVKMG